MKNSVDHHRPRSGLRKWGLRGLILFAGLGAVYFLVPKILHYLSHVSTDDAFVTGTVVPISPQVKGRVVTIYIEDNQKVYAGEPLFDIESDDYAVRVEQAQKALLELVSEKDQLEATLKEAKETLAKDRADLQSAKARMDYALKQKNRYQELAKTRAVAKSQFDLAESQWKVAQADYKADLASISEAAASVHRIEAQIKTQKYKIEKGQAAVTLAEIDLRRTRVKAPLTGRIAKKNVDPGKYVQAGQPVLSVVSAEEVWVVANFKETDVQKIEVGQPVEIKVDAYPGITFKGRVNSFQPGTGAVFALLPPENATGNYVKVVQRVPVKILFASKPDPLHPLWPGLSVVPSIAVKAGRK
jgi:membrane fusion protein (multidrug efflux system)